MSTSEPITFLCTYYAHPEFLKICLNSLRKFHPDAQIIVSQQEGDGLVDVGDARLIKHNMKEYMWAEVAIRLLKQCDTDIAVFIEHDAFLLRPLTELIDKMDKHDLIGPEEVLDFRNSPGMVCQNFFIVNAKKLKELGLENVRIRDIEKLRGKIGSMESGYGISQTFDKKLFLPIEKSGYGFGTYYGNYVHHFWFGSYRKRDTIKDGILPEQLEVWAEELIEDYWNGKFNIV